MITIEGLNGIKATVLAHSITKAGKEMIGWEIEYPRLILAELNTHRQLSRNSFSSRAVPFLKMLEQLNGEPVRFGANQAGMQDKGEDYNASVEIWENPNGIGEQGYLKEVPPKTAWAQAKSLAISIARAFYEAGYHKQVYNRLLEPWQMQKTVLSATEVDNFFWLRDDDAADPTIRELARVMKAAKDASTPELLQPGEWHLPYIDTRRDPDGTRVYGTKDPEGLSTWEFYTLEEAIKVSCARCAAVSYRNEGYGLEKSLELYDRLVGSEKKHASALEHCATPMMEHRDKDTVMEVNAPNCTYTWEEGITHMDRQGNLWSGNLQGWIQFRKLIRGECYTPE